MTNYKEKYKKYKYKYFNLLNNYNLFDNYNYNYNLNNYSPPIFFQIQPKKRWNCNHTFCNNNQNILTIGILPFTIYNGIKYVLFGLPTFGNLYGCIGGKIENFECPIQAIIRETKEEIKINFNENDFLNSTPKLIYNTFIFPIEINLNGKTPQIFRDEINNLINIDNLDLLKAQQYKELSRVDFFNKDGKTIDGNSYLIHSKGLLVLSQI